MQEGLHIRSSSGVRSCLSLGSRLHWRRRRRRLVNTRAGLPEAAGRRVGCATRGRRRTSCRNEPTHFIIGAPLEVVANLMLQSSKPNQAPAPDRAQPKPGAAMAGCPMHQLKAKLRYAGMRPTRQRVALGWLLFAKGPRHITAETLYEEASAASVTVSLATIYNTLHQFTRAGLLRE